MAIYYYKDRGCRKMINEEIKSNYLRIITDNEIIKEYRIDEFTSEVQQM